MFGPAGTTAPSFEVWPCSAAGTAATTAPVFSDVSRKSRLVHFEEGTNPPKESLTLPTLVAANNTMFLRKGRADQCRSTRPMVRVRHGRPAGGRRSYASWER